MKHWRTEQEWTRAGRCGANLRPSVDGVGGGGQFS